MKNRKSSSKSKGAGVCIGIHTSIAGRLSLAAERAHELGCDGFQIFSASPRSWSSRDLNGMEVREFIERRETLGLSPLVIHCNYLINLAAAQPMLRARSLQAFKGELVRAQALEADYLILHPGSAVGQSRLDAVRNVITGLRMTIQSVRPKRLQVLLECTAGQGSVLGADLKELAFMVNALSDCNLGACLDTAHLHGAGYDVRTASGLEQTLAEAHSTLGLDKVKVIHFNDSRAEFNSRVDRHENIGKGKIGREGMGRILRHPALRAIPFILETPIDRPGDDMRNMKAARRLATAVAGSRPRTKRAATGQSRQSKQSSKAVIRKPRAKRTVKR